MSKKLKWIIIILVILVIVFIALSKAGVLGGGDEGTKVATEKATIRNITEVVTASGKVFPEVEVKVSPDIS